MDFVSRLIVGTWIAGAAGQTLAAARLTRSGMMRTYPVLTISLATAAALQWWQLIALQQGGWSAYAAAWRALQPVTLMLVSAMVMEAVYAMSKHFPRARTLAAVVMSAIAVLALAAVIPVAESLAPAWGELGAIAELLLQRRNWNLCLLTVLVGCRLVMLWLEPAMRRNVTRYVDAGIVALGAAAAGDLIIRAKLGYWGNAAGQFVLAVPPLGSLWLWSRMEQGGEAYRPTWDATVARATADAEMVRFQEKARRAAAGQGSEL